MKTTRAIHQKITQLRQVVNKSKYTLMCAWYGAKAVRKPGRNSSIQRRIMYRIQILHTHPHTHTHTVYRCRLTVDGIRIGELSAVTRLRMTSMVAKHCSENSLVSIYLHASLEMTTAQWERLSVASGEHSSLSKRLPHPTWHPCPHLSGKRTFGRWLKICDSRQTLSINSSRAYRSTGSPSSPSLKPMATLHC